MKTLPQSDWLDDHRPHGAGPGGDNSVMFSLRALMATDDAAGTRASAARAPVRVDRNESGLIDLSALQTGEAPAIGHHLEVFPFGDPMATPTSAASAPADAPRATSSAPAPARRTAVARYAAVAVLTVVAAGAGAFSGQRAARAELGPPAVVGLSRVASAIEARLPGPDATPSRPDAASPSAPAQDPGARAVAANDAPVTVAPRAPEGRRPLANSTVGSREGARAVPLDGTVKRPPAADPCNGDLTCAMRRAAGG